MQPIVDLYPIVVELDETILDDHGGTSNHDPNQPAIKHGTVYDAVASEASLFAPERSWMIDEDARIDAETDVGLTPRKKRGGRFFLQSPKSPRRNRSFGSSRRHDFEDEWNVTKQQIHPVDTSRAFSHDSSGDGESTPSGGAFASLRSFLSGYQRRRGGGSCPDSKTTSTTVGGTETDRKLHVADRISLSSVGSVPSLARVGMKRNRPRRFHDDYVLTQQVRGHDER